MAGYHPSDELGREASAGTLVHHSAEDLGTMLEKLAGDDASMAWIHEGNKMEEPFPGEDDNVDWDIDRDELAAKSATKRKITTATKANTRPKKGAASAATETLPVKVTTKHKTVAATTETKKTSNKETVFAAAGTLSTKSATKRKIVSATTKT